jgi:multidrug efflux pump subunit AcrA (membrane-fusion protein)
VLPLLVFVFGGCGAQQKEQEAVVPVQVTPASAGEISQVVSAEAVVFPLQQAVVAPKITSTIKSFLVQRGNKVHKGQLLAVLENADLSAATEQSKGEYEQAEASYTTTTGASLPEQIQKAELDAAAAKTSFEAQQKMYDSRKDLFQQGALPRRDLDAGEVALAQARSQFEQAQKQLDDLHRIGREQALKSATGQLSAAKGKYLGAEAQYSYSQIRSPIDGVITDRPQYPGELATANQPLLTVMDLSKLIAKAHIAQSQAAFFKVGNPATLVVSGLDEPVKGRLSLISPALDPGSTTIEVWVEVTKPPSQLKPGMTVQVSVSARTVPNAVVVPASAVFKNAEGAEYVVVAGSDNVAHTKTVQTGIHGADQVQITSGIILGDQVITSGGYALPDKTKIKVESAAPSGKEPADDDNTSPAQKEKD